MNIAEFKIIDAHKINYEIGKGTEERYINRWVAFAEYSFGLGFTFEIISFAILGYKYLIDISGDKLLALMLPIIFLAATWCIMKTVSQYLINTSKFL